MFSSASTKSRKRKTPTEFYGYDPSIAVLPGDPRLNPSWFGVHYHPDQPVTNEWNDWSGGAKLFDISTNKQLDVAPNEQKRSRKLKSDPFIYRRPTNLVLHAAQPITNDWQAWKSMEEENQLDEDLDDEQEAKRLFATIEQILKTASHMQNGDKKNGLAHPEEPRLAIPARKYQPIATSEEKLPHHTYSIKLEQRKKNIGKKIERAMYARLLNVESINAQFVSENMRKLSMREFRVDECFLRKILKSSVITQANRFRQFEHEQVDVMVVTNEVIKGSRGNLLKDEDSARRLIQLIKQQEFQAELQKSAELAADAFKSMQRARSETNLQMSSAVRHLSRQLKNLYRRFTACLEFSERINCSKDCLKELVHTVVTIKICLKLLKIVARHIEAGPGETSPLWPVYRFLKDTLTSRQLELYFAQLAKWQRKEYFASVRY